MMEQITFCFEPPKMIISDNRRCFSVNEIQKFMKVNKIMWKMAMEYALRSNGRAERMVGTIKKQVAERVFQKQQSCNAAIRPISYGYQRKAKYRQPGSFQLMYGVVPRRSGDELFSMVGIPVRLLSEELQRSSALSLTASRSEQQNPRLRSTKAPHERKFEHEDEVIVARGKALGKLKTGAFQSKWYEQCQVVVENCPGRASSPIVRGFLDYQSMLGGCAGVLIFASKKY